METFKIGDCTFYAPRWDMEKQFENQKYILPLINSPVVNSMSVGDDAELVLPAIISGLLDALATTDMKALAMLFFKDLTMEPKGAVATIVSFKTLEAAGLDMSDALQLLVKLIVLQYGALLKKGLQGILEEIMSALMPESKPSLKE